MTATPILELRDVDIAADGGDPICRKITLTVREGERHILLGPNGSGKSTLLAGIMGIHPFSITGGEALLYGRDLTEMSVEERARAGVGMAFQRPPAITGVSVRKLAEAIGAEDSADEQLKAMTLTHLADRDLHCGFSGGESKRFEVAKLALQSPSLCLFDEPESGVDLEQVATVGNAINELLSSPGPNGAPRAGIVITHTGFILNHLRADVAHLMVDGTLTDSGDPQEMFTAIRDGGYRARATA